MAVKLNIPLEINNEVDLQKIVVEVERGRAELKRQQRVVPTVGQRFRYQGSMSGNIYFRIRAKDSSLIILPDNEEKFTAVMVVAGRGYESGLGTAYAFSADTASKYELIP